MPSTTSQRSDRIEGGPKVIDGYLTTGSSPGESATVHLLGLGSVGRSLVHRLPQSGFRIVGVSDRSGSLLPSSRQDVLDAAAHKAEGTPLSANVEALRIPPAEVLTRTRPDIVVDATHTDLDRNHWHNFLQLNVLRPGRGLALASKDGLCLRGPVWCEEFGLGRVRFNAVLGGTGGAFAADLALLRSRASECEIAGNASTTAIIEVVEEGGDITEGINEAERLGLLEPDPELDLRGVDAATKLAIVVGLIQGRPVDPRSVVGPDIRDLSASVLRRRKASGSTTRLVGRYSKGSRPVLQFEELPLGHPLALARDQVRYRYRLSSGEVIEHSGGGLGADATADALIADVVALAASLAQRGGVR